MGLLTGLRGGTLAPSRLVRLAPAAVDVAAFDAFTDDDATTLENHAATDGGTWTKHGLSGAGDAAIAGNRAHDANAAGTRIYYHSWLPASADYRAEADLVLVTDTDLSAVCVCGRMDTVANTHYLLFYSTNGNVWQVYRNVAGTLTQLGSTVGQTLTQGQTYRAALDMRGARITALVDGLPIIAATDASPIAAAGRAGLRFQSSATATTGLHIDAFRVRA